MICGPVFDFLFHNDDDDNDSYFFSPFIPDSLYSILEKKKMVCLLVECFNSID